MDWTGPNNDRDYVGVGEPNGRPYLDYKYTRSGRPVKLAVPEKPGNYEVRYVLGSDNTVVASQAFTVTGVTATLSAPAQVAAGAKFQFTWTGPDNPRDFITLVKAGTQEKTYDRYEYTKNGKTLTAPDAAGEYELRYATGQAYLTLARAAVTVTSIQGSLAGPATVVGGESFRVTWKGPDNPRNFITIVAKDAKEGAFGHYAYTNKNNPVSLLAPLAAGDYELRYSTAESYVTLASGIVGGEAVTVAAGNHSVRLKARAGAPKPVVVKPKETASVAFLEGDWPQTGNGCRASRISDPHQASFHICVSLTSVSRVHGSGGLTCLGRPATV